MNTSAKPPVDADLDAIAAQIVDAAFRVHRTLGPGLLESIYETCLCIDLEERGLICDRQVVVPVHYRGRDVGPGLRADLVVEKRILVELKAVESLLPVHEVQVLSYLKLMNLRLGLLINFNVVLIKHGIKRIIL